MRTDLDRSLEPDQPSPYAPGWVRAAHDAKRSGVAATPDGAQPTRVARELQLPDDEQHAPAEQGIAIEQFRLPRSLEPTVVPLPDFGSRSLGRPFLLMTVILAAGAA